MALPLPTVLKNIVFEYLPNVEVLPWIDESKLDRANLYSNPAAMHMISMSLDIPGDCWFSLCKNPAAIDFLEKNLEFVNWKYLSANPAAIHLLEKNLNLVSRSHLATNPGISSSIILTEESKSYPIYENPTRFDNWEKTNWHQISANPAAIDKLMHNPDKIDWGMFSANPAAIDILKNNPDKIDYKNLSRNPKIFRPVPMDEIRRRL